MSSSSKPKSFKADGTPKKRWTAAERAAKGRKPRKSGGVRDKGRDHRDVGGDRGRTDSHGRTFQTWKSDDRRDRQDRGDRHDWNDRGRDGAGRRSDGRRDERWGGRRDDRRSGRRDDRWHNDRGNRSGGYRSDRGYRSDNDRFDNYRSDKGGRGRGRYDNRRDDWRDGDSERREDRRQSRSRDGEWNGRRGGRGESTGANRRSQRDWEDRRRSRDRRSEYRERSDDRDVRSRDHHEGRDEGTRDGGYGCQGYRSHDHRDDRRDRSERFERRDNSERFEHRDNSERFEDHGSDSDQMEWHAEELSDLDVSTVDHEGGFSALGVPDRIVAALAATGIDAPFRIQIAAIPDAIAGRDVLGRASTGSGKTLAFGVPVLSRLATAERPDRRPRALILSPTRELAMQIADVLSPLASSMDLSTILIAGGMSYGPQTKAFRKGVDLVVATPGRLVDLLETGDADLSGIEVAVLDEADHMADMGFMPAVSAILDAVPEQAQHLLFSATLDDAVSRLVKRYLHDPVTHEIDPEKGAVATATHHAFHIKPHEKVQLMCEISNRPGHTIVFARTQRGASRMAEQLRDAGVMAGALHGGLTQGARARVLAAFKKGSLPVLVATDVAARGIDVDDVTLVLQVDPPMNSKDYLHRSGRTARAGHDGAVVSLVLPHQRRSMTRLYHGAGVSPVQTQARLGDEAVAEIADCSPVSGEPIAQADYDALVAPRPQKSRKARRGGQYDGHRGHGNNRGYRGGKGSHGGYRGGKGSYGSRNDHSSREDHRNRYGRSGNDTW